MSGKGSVRSDRNTRRILRCAPFGYLANRDNERSPGKLSAAIEFCKSIAHEYAFSGEDWFANILRYRAEGIANACIVKKGANMLEGANNKIKALSVSAAAKRTLSALS